MEPFNMLEIPIKAIIDIIAYGMILLKFADFIDNALLFLGVYFMVNS
jgi:hypothetical protein